MAATSKSSASVQDEIINIGQTLTYVQDRLAQLAKRCQVENSDKLRQLEYDNTRLREGIKQLRIVNAELQQKAKVHKPELDRAVQAREAAFRKLRHARRVIKDLVEEKEVSHR
ncbi:hypothetical protein AX15_002356 [Amanita polypyramis BW_CC]|nr:hypothetical protein AX15_002356 [Amanita polypyramis BW_CC]